MNTKTKKSFTLGMAVIGSYLFYKQDAGINIFIFTIISAFALMYLHKQKGYKTLSLAILPSLLSSIFIVWYPQLFTRTIWVLGYLLMWSRMLPTPYPIVTLFQGLVSICESPIRLLKKGEIQPKTKATGQHKNIIYIITTTIVLVFILLYIKSNPVFSKLFSNIDLSFIEFGFLMTIIGLYLLLNGLVTINANKKIQGLNSIKSTITKTTITQRDQQEYLIAKLSIGTIGIILFIANITDLIVIITGKLLEGITYSEYVHQGFNTLIFTLGLAIAIIIYFFRGQLNFHHHLKVIKRSGSFWILQNILLALITATKTCSM
ncbi:hypothetical protein JCM21142_73049 [Saccharicrinis fermentans DSM 9555 = JCM 21142]|uniref:Uncharacterized protein n=1 Tax=Saccharicrinis fermentans DSM 9555 = JCM 21142 TaxID=869213 RepID=W7YIQ0_9BACT|nr:hypothetical protein JCM21142_73049 [Saccharicrinis fermentans DSM 9555 = JCM 21142]